MSVTKEPSGRRSIAVETEVPGTPEEVWRAIATGPGISSWFVRTEVEERPGGSMVMDFGPGMELRATVGAWEAPHRFTAESEPAPGWPTMTTEWTVEARSGGTCLVRVVHSLFAEGDEWDEQLLGTEAGWPGWFRILRLYLEHFRGERCTAIAYFAPAAAEAAAAWEALAEGLGVAGAAVGEHRTAPAGPPPFAGVVEFAGAGGQPHQVLLRFDRPAPGIGWFAVQTMGGQTFLMAYLYFYGDEGAAAAARDEAAWRTWLAGVVG